MPLIDIGVNLLNKRFHTDREATLNRALEADVQYMILTGTSLKSSQASADYAAMYPGVLYTTAGVHPHDASEFHPETTDALRTLARRPEVVAIGECGLDFNRDFSPREQQLKAFEAQVALACELQMPLFLHERDAHDPFLNLLKGFSNLPKVVVHCFTGEKKALEHYLEAGFYIGITGWVCDERRGLDLQRLVPLIPHERLMIETDAPYLTPRDMRPKPKGGRNEPAFLPHILKTLAKLYDCEPDFLAQQTTRNAQTFFQLQ